MGSHGVPVGTGRWDKAIRGEGGEELCDLLEMGEGEGGRWSSVERWNRRFEFRGMEGELEEDG